MTSGRATDGEAAFAPTHRSPAAGLRAWTAADPASPLAPSLDPGLELEVNDRRGEWAHVRCSNGWTTWVDARLLHPLPTPEDNDLLLAGARAIDTYRTLLTELVAGRLDVVAFRRAAFAVGFIAREREVYMLDVDRGRFARYDGISIVFGPPLTDLAGASGAR